MRMCGRFPLTILQIRMRETGNGKGLPSRTALFFHKHNSFLINIPRSGMFDFETKCPVLKKGVFIQPVVRIHYRRAPRAHKGAFRPKPATDNGVR